MSRTAAQLVRQYVGKPVAVKAGKSVEWAGKVVDAKSAYGRELLLVRPVVGAGGQWFEAKSCRVVAATWGQANALDEHE